MSQNRHNSGPRWTRWIASFSLVWCSGALAQVMETHSFLGINQSIPDGTPGGLSDARLVSSAIGQLTSVGVRLQIAGNFNGDLYGYLRHVIGGQTNICVLVNRVGRTASNPSGYDDTGIDLRLRSSLLDSDVHLYRAYTNLPFGSPLVGDWPPDGRGADPADVLDSSPIVTSLDSFLGVAGRGEWTLYLADLESGGTNQLVGWRLELAGAPAPAVVGRWVFYNQSAWDNDDAAANPQDDAAIAPDKTALLPGGTATFANYTSYSRGLNGIMVDLPLEGSPSAADFTFKRGNNDAPAGWAAAPAPSTIAVRPGAGVGGADRVTLIWPNNTIAKQWLEVTVLATANTGLADADVFYFGNAIGETGDSVENAQVNSTDIGGVRSHPRFAFNPAPIDFPYDINRDTLVNSTDIGFVRVNPTFSFNALRLIAPPPGAGDPQLANRASVPRSMASLGLPPELWLLRNPDRSVSVGVRNPGNGEYRLEFSRNPVAEAWRPAGAPLVRETERGVWTIQLDPEDACGFFRVIARPAERTPTAD